MRSQLIDHPYPPTKIMWVPDYNGVMPDLFATSGEYLRLWEINSATGGVALRAELTNSKESQYAAPLTSFDWNMDDPSTMGTCSIDTTCTLWDLSKQTIKTQLIAHEKEVYDFAFAPGVFTFATAGADGSIRQFDVRDLAHSNILYDNQNQVPFVRLVWNRTDPKLIATIMMDSNKVTILDIRFPSIAFQELSGHNAFVNSVSWAPTSQYLLMRSLATTFLLRETTPKCSSGTLAGLSTKPLLSTTYSNPYLLTMQEKR
eukprot:TRINITY_DN2896_c0_g1_i21.p1 TRINITY_DN2896_c0_g1~~TRINITY_DN2896_c0_g1_i21.p1  ORF type:complete len:259 (-),score=44.82 TRINITY_DN2896_c0_g1_i21:207-983(-)